MINLYDTYGYCILPKDIFLYRSGKLGSDSIFLSFQPTIAKRFGTPIDKVEVWKTQAEVKLLFAISHLKKDARVISAIDRIFKALSFAESESSTLQIKQSIQLRADFIEKLRQQAICGWFSSLEDNKPWLEVCIISSSYPVIKKICEITVEDKNKLYPENALKHVLFFPGREFLDRSNMGDYKFDLYQKKFRQNCLFETNLSQEESINLNFDLRMAMRV